MEEDGLIGALVRNRRLRDYEVLNACSYGIDASGTITLLLLESLKKRGVARWVVLLAVAIKVISVAVFAWAVIRNNLRIKATQTVLSFGLALVFVVVAAVAGALADAQS